MENNIKSYLPQISEYFVKDFGKEYGEVIRQRINDSAFLFVSTSLANKRKLSTAIDNQLLRLTNQFCKEAGNALGISSPYKILTPEELSELKYYDVLIKSSSELNDETYIDFVKFLGKLVQKDKISQKNCENYIKNDKNKEIIKNCIKTICQIYDKNYVDKMRDLTRLKRQLLSNEEPSKTTGAEDRTIDEIDALDIDENEKDILKIKIAEYVLNDETAGFSFYTKSTSGKDMRVCILPPLEELNDSILFHEISHTVNAHNYSAKSGFTLIIDDDNKENQDLDEIITDYFALKAQNLAQKEGFKVCNNENELSLYSCAFMLFRNFLEGYAKDIKSCRMSGDPSLLDKTFGKENIKSLSQLATQFLDLIDTERQGEIVNALEEKYGFDIDKIDFSQKPKSYYEKQYLKFAKTMQETLNNIKEFQKDADSENSL